MLDSIFIPTHTNSGFNEFQKLFPIINYVSPMDISNKINKEPIVLWCNDEGKENNLSNLQSRVYNIWVCYILAMPLHHQRKAIFLYREFFPQKEMVAEFIIELATGKQNYDDEKMLPRINNIIYAAKNASSNPKNVIISFIERERPNSLYDMICFMKTNIE